MFFCCTAIPLEDQKTVNTKWYTEICLLKVINEIFKNNKNHLIILHHDNTSSCTAPETINYLNDKDIKLMSYCPYFPDLSPNNIFLFSYVKQKMHGQRFSPPREAVDAFHNHASEISTTDLEKLYQELI